MCSDHLNEMKDQFFNFKEVGKIENPRMMGGGWF